MKRKKGFTLVELIVVIAIIAILSAVAVPLTVNYLASAEKSATLDEIKLAKDSLNLASTGFRTANVEVSADSFKTEFFKHISKPQNLHSVKLVVTEENGNSRVVANICGVKYYNKLEGGTLDTEKAVTYDMGTFSKSIMPLALNDTVIYLRT